MNSLILLLQAGLGFVFGAIAFGFLYFLFLKKQKNLTQYQNPNENLEKNLNDEINELKTQIQVKTKELDLMKAQKEKSEQHLNSERIKSIDLEKRISSFQSDNKNLTNQVKKLESIEESLEKKMNELLIKIHDQSHDRISKTSKDQWNSLISPFKLEIDELKKTVKDTYEKESRDSLSLKGQIEAMAEIYQKMTKSTDSLSKALRGDSKTQGDWGEILLERLLESAHLIKGEHYITQARGLGLKDEQGKVQKPDVVINLPGNRNLIIDSKVSLVAYERYICSETEKERTEHGKEMLNSINHHIDDLSKKDYASLTKMNSPDFVLLFIPNDGMFGLVSSLDREIYSRAIAKGINLVSPSFLLPSLRLVQNIWQHEKQTKNALKIAEEAGRLYDKFVGFTLDLEKVQGAIKKADLTTGDAMKKLSTGQGSLVAKANLLKELGAKTTKKLEGH